MIRHSSLPKIWCQRTFQHRFYKSLATSFSIPTESRIIEKKDFERIKKANRVNPNLDDVFTEIKIDPVLGELTADRVQKFQSFLGEEYRLKDEYLTLALHPWEDRHVELRYQKEGKTEKLSTQSFSHLGKQLYSLHANLALLNLGSSNASSAINGLNFDRFDEQINWLVYFHGKCLSKFLDSVGIRKWIFHTGKPAAKYQQVAARKSIFMIISLISFEHGEKLAKKFIDERLIYGKDRVLYLAKEIISK